MKEIQQTQDNTENTETKNGGGDTKIKTQNGAENKDCDQSMTEDKS